MILKGLTLNTTYTQLRKPEDTHFPAYTSSTTDSRPVTEQGFTKPDDDYSFASFGASNDSLNETNISGVNLAFYMRNASNK
ncbi:hypothetical protein E2C01_017384 [Portunus trituberculatus]|uniref:Uncharacterized protein n=1 Tax=Portunus trituberculatus TaxID=210409 RepID=A0A5B7DTH7_PORTR|nr:hypothetical protein [Portunus trituberculatus]